MARITTIGACVALALITTGSVNAVRAQNVCCLFECNGGLSECLGLVSAGSCGGTCDQICSASGCSSASEASCPGAETVGCGGGAACVPTCGSTVTPTSTPTATPTNTPVPQGGACSTPSQCGTGFCANGVCCNSACTDPLMRCNLAGQVGTCARAAASAPTLTPWGLFAASMLLAGIAGLALRRRMRS